MKSKKSIFSKILITAVCVIIVFLIGVKVIPAVYITFQMMPSLKYSINERKGLYPSVRDLGNAVWVYNDSEIDIELITIDGEIFGEITTGEKSFTIRGKFLYCEMYLFCSHLDNPQEADWKYSEHNIITTYYEYVNGELVCSNVRPDSSHFDFSKNFTLTKKKSIDNSLIQNWKCEEVPFQLLSYNEFDNYAIIKYNHAEYKLIKLFDNYYELIFAYLDYCVYGSLEKQNENLVFNIVYTYNDENIIDEQYIPDNIKVLTFIKQ